MRESILTAVREIIPKKFDCDIVCGELIISGKAKDGLYYYYRVSNDVYYATKTCPIELVARVRRGVKFLRGYNGRKKERRA